MNEVIFEWQVLKVILANEDGRCTVEGAAFNVPFWEAAAAFEEAATRLRERMRVHGIKVPGT